MISAEHRRAIAEHWRRRARSELEVGRAFAAMAPLLASRGADAIVVELLERGARDEERHAALCMELARTYADEPLESPVIFDVPLPTFGERDPDLEIALLVSGMCCINETIATAWLSACLSAAIEPIAVAANRAHLRDEIDHARLGWAHLASRAVSPDIRDALAARLPALLAANLPGWERADAVLPDEGIPEHGHPSTAASRRVVHDAVRDVVLPGFAFVGIDTRAAVDYVESRLMPKPRMPEARDATGHLIRELHGITLVQILEYLVDRIGFEGLASRITVNCFRVNPSIKSSLVFLRRTPWARAKVEALYVELRSSEPAP